MQTKHVTPFEHEGKTYYFALDAAGQEIYMTGADLRTFEAAKVTQHQVENWFGDDQTDNYAERISEILNGDYPVRNFRYEVLTYNEDDEESTPIFNDKHLIRICMNANKEEYHNVNF
jgi:hypothetical protein